MRRIVASRGVTTTTAARGPQRFFFYVLDRTNGELLLAKPFLRRVDWGYGDWGGRTASGDRPEKDAPMMRQIGARRRHSGPVTRLFYFLALEECTGSPLGYIRTRRDKRFFCGRSILRLGRLFGRWPQSGAAKAKTVVGRIGDGGRPGFFFPTASRTVDSRLWMSAMGRGLWGYETNVRMKASPMTFEVRESSTWQWPPGQIFCALGYSQDSKNMSDPKKLQQPLQQLLRSIEQHDMQQALTQARGLIEDLDKPSSMPDPRGGERRQVPVPFSGLFQSSHSDPA